MINRGRTQGNAHWRGVYRVVAAGVSLLAVSACAIQPEPFTGAETSARVRTDLQEMFAGQEPLLGALTLHEAMARALAYNLEARQRVMEQAFSQQQLNLAQFDMLPRMAADAGYVGRDNINAASSESIITRRQSLEPSTSQDRDRRVGDLNVVWNVLDFGVSWIAAKQQADRTLIAQERRRKVVHNIIQDVRSAYWRAVAAERLLGRIDQLTGKIRQAQASSAEIGRRAVSDPIEALSYRRALLDAVRQLETQRRELALAKTELATLINLPPTTPIRLAATGNVLGGNIPIDVSRMETLALNFRPELREEDYQARISHAEARKALLALLPGLQLSAGAHGDSNGFLVNNNWADYGLKVTWNLMRLISGPATIAAAEAGGDVAVARRRALSMAVLAQVHVARANYMDAARQYKTATELESLDNQILAQLRSRASSGAGGGLASIQGELSALQSSLRKDIAHADLRNAFGRLFVTVGADPLPEALDSADIKTVARALAATEAAWARGQIGALQGKDVEASLSTKPRS
jgi:outer membrane protein, multidrug efflux system